MARRLALVSQPIIAHRLTLLWEDQLIDDDVVRVNLVRRQLLDKSLRLVQRQELRNADADESGLVLHVERVSNLSLCQVFCLFGHTGSLNWVLTSVMIARIESSLANMSS
jgi:hypothetical protein